LGVFTLKNRNTLLFATNTLQDIKKKRKIYETYINEKEAELHTATTYKSLKKLCP